MLLGKLECNGLCFGDMRSVMNTVSRLVSCLWYYFTDTFSSTTVEYCHCLATKQRPKEHLSSFSFYLNKLCFRIVLHVQKTCKNLTQYP